MSNILQIAIRVLQNIEKGQIAQAALEETGLAGSQRQICSDLVYGFMRTHPRLQKELSQYLPQPQKLPAPMRKALELAVYAHLFQERSQIELVCNDTITFVKKRFGQKMANVANAVLRAATGRPPDSNPPTEFGQWAEWHAMPQTIASLWKDAYGETAARNIIKRSFARPHAALRVNPPHREEILPELQELPHAVPLTRNGVAFPPGTLPPKIGENTLQNLLHKGILSFQAAGSQVILEKLDLPNAWKNWPIWDACAGFGGKTTALLEAGLKVQLASDTNFGRLRHLRPECARLRIPPPKIAAMSATTPAILSWHGHILADIPCSGLGVLARRPDIKIRHDPYRLPALQALQTEILHTLADMLEKDRELAIITCTLDPAENEQLTEKLLDRGLELTAQWQTPHDHPWLEGMYGARLRKP